MPNDRVLRVCEAAVYAGFGLMEERVKEEIKRLKEELKANDELLAQACRERDIAKERLTAHETSIAALSRSTRNLLEKVTLQENRRDTAREARALIPTVLERIEGSKKGGG